MEPTIRALVALEAGVNRAAVESALPREGKVDITGIVEGEGVVDRVLNDRSADLLAIGSHGAPEAVLGLVAESSVAQPGRPIVVFCEDAPDYFARQLFEAGAEDVIKLPETPERVEFAFEKAVTRRLGADLESQANAAPMVCVLGPKGGSGKTVIATNLAAGLANVGRSPVLVDLDLQFGDVGLALGISPERTLYDLATSGGALDAEKLEAYLVSHPSGAKALLAPVRPDQASAVEGDLLREVYSLLRARHDFVIVDTPPDFTPEVIGAIDASSNVVIVGMLDSLSLKNTKLGIETLELMGYDLNRVTVVLNRANSRVGIDLGDIEQVIGRRPDILMPSERDVPRSINSGEPIILGHPSSGAASAIRALIEIYAPGQLPAPAAGSSNGRNRSALIQKRRLFGGRFR